MTNQETAFSDGEQSLVSSFLRLVELADPYYQNCHQQVLQLTEPGHPWRLATSQSEFGFEAVAVASNLIQASANSLLSLKFLTFGTPEMKSESELTQNVRVTLNGTAGLIRQMLENAAFAFWLLSSTNLEELNERGFAAVWWNAGESRRYHDAIGSLDVHLVRSRYESLRNQGQALGLFTTDSSGEISKEPRVRLSDVCGILRHVEVALDVPQGDARIYLGSNFLNAEWTYRWLSGYTHGAVWVNGYSDAEGLQVVQPDWFRNTHSLLVAHQVLERAVGLLSCPKSTLWTQES